MTPRRFQVEIEWDPEDRVWVTYVPALGHLSTYGETREDALAQTRDAVLGVTGGRGLQCRAGTGRRPPARRRRDRGGCSLTRLPRVSGRDLVKALRRAGYEHTHVRGSHHYLRHPDGGRLITTPSTATATSPLGRFDRSCAKPT